MTTCKVLEGMPGGGSCPAFSVDSGVVLGGEVDASGRLPRSLLPGSLETRDQHGGAGAANAQGFARDFPILLNKRKGDDKPHYWAWGFVLVEQEDSRRC